MVQKFCVKSVVVSTLANQVLATMLRFGLCRHCFQRTNYLQECTPACPRHYQAGIGQSALEGMLTVTNIVQLILLLKDPAS